MVLDGLAHPIVQAPMGGGPSTPALAAAVGEAGGLGFLAAGYKTVDAVRADIEALRALTDRPFGVNLFAPPQAAADDIAPFAARLEAEAERYGAPVGDPRHDDDGWEAKLALMAELEVPVVSFTFGCPRVSELAALGRDVGDGDHARPRRARRPPRAPTRSWSRASRRAATVPRSTTRRPARSACWRCSSSCATRSTCRWSPPAASPPAAPSPPCSPPAPRPRSSAPRSCCATRRPPRPPTARRSPQVATPRSRASFTGRSARGVVNRWLREHDAGAPRAYPDVHHLTAKIRAAAREQGDPDGFHLWAGQAHSLATGGPAGDLVRRLAAEADEAIRSLRG